MWWAHRLGAKLFFGLEELSEYVMLRYSSGIWKRLLSALYATKWPLSATGFLGNEILFLLIAVSLCHFRAILMNFFPLSMLFLLGTRKLRFSRKERKRESELRFVGSDGLCFWCVERCGWVALYIRKGDRRQNKCTYPYAGLQRKQDHVWDKLDEKGLFGWWACFRSMWQPPEFILVEPTWLLLCYLTTSRVWSRGGSIISYFLWDCFLH